MKNIIALLLSLAISAPISVHAENAENESLLRFAKAIGIYEQIEEQKSAMKSQGAQAAKQQTKQILASIPDIPVDFSKEIETELEIYLSNISSIIDTEFAVNSYIRLISDKLTVREISEITKFYESELGEKFTQSNTEIMGAWTNEFMGDVNKKFVDHLNDFSTRIMAKASNYNQSN